MFGERMIIGFTLFALLNNLTWSTKCVHLPCWVGVGRICYHGVGTLTPIVGRR